MKKIIVILMVMAMSVTTAIAQVGFSTYHDRTNFLMSSPGSLKFGLYGYDNPAVTATMNQPDVMFQWSDDGGFTDFNYWGLFAGGPNSGFGVTTQNIGDVRLSDYRISAGMGDESGSIGIGYGWYGGDFDLDRTITLGSLMRPSRFFSLGFTGTRSLEQADYEGVLDVGVRPFGSHYVTLFGDFAVNSTQGFEDAIWSAGASVEALPGIRVTSRYIDDVGITAGIQVNFSRAGVRAQTHLDADANHAFNTYGIRAGAYDRNINDAYLAEEDNYVNVSLRGSRPYQARRYFDDSTTLRETLEMIEESRKDPTVAGVVINATAMGLSQGMVWEVREELGKLREEGKKVIVYLERSGMNALHLISEADKVVMDPEGSLVLPGYVMGNTYLSEMLGSLGIGVDEFREMEYKSAFETFSRTEMSEADREQRQALIDGFYDLAKEGIMESRGFSESEYDSLIDFGAALLPDELIETGMVDTLVRYTDINGVIEDVEGEKKSRISSENLITYQQPGDDVWGRKPEIGLLYAIGPTQTESGIRGRELASEIRSMRNNDNIKAIVMRADSPGGDALASDLVAEELKKTSEDKPVIVTMGNVAASGGYWISMYADTIMALPNTITGSIGVIGGWLYDDGFSDILNLHTDHVKRGESADLMFGPTLPLIGLSLPGRSLTEEERERFVGRLNSLYDRFIDKVAEGRDQEYDDIKEVAAGRVWTGDAALDRGLVDEIGGLYSAIDLAREAAGIGEDEKFDIVEGPEPQMFRLPGLLSLLGIEEPKEKDPMVEYLEMMLDHSGEPMVVLPFEFYHFYYQQMYKGD